MTDDEIDRIQTLAGIQRRGEGFVSEDTGCVMDQSVPPETAKNILRRLARHITPGEWDAAVRETPEWDGCLSPNQNGR